MTKIVIIGGVAGGASAAARARRLSEDAQIIMFERGPFVSFANCGLPSIPGIDNPLTYSLRNIPDMDKIIHTLEQNKPTYATVVGGAIEEQDFVTGKPTAIHFDEIDHLTENQLLLDVRNPGELEKLGYIGEPINIPVDQLRQRMHELPKDKEIIIYCQVGLRGISSISELWL
ncbi:rhodanese-like domain-containing protein [Moritella yayanosii]|uniref:Rhodanese domain-containing protein n=1 Tax=Moritella yayanosii TaxID=69539 RepID=A0A330LNP6_9GAMM|nr:rhodanese-like domain-containing protein [Moritella yayanosii]SQD78279.1 exported protein of unknown function, might belong to Coenzyme A disulfide reductase [Moritella yayanosii]